MVGTKSESATQAEFDPTAFENYDFPFVAKKEEERDNDSEEEGRSSTQLQDNKPHRQATVFVIDCCRVQQCQLPERLFVKKEEEGGEVILRDGDVSPWKSIFSTIARFIKAKIVSAVGSKSQSSSQFDKVGVVLYGVSSDTKDTTDALNMDLTYPEVETLLELDFLSRQGIQLIEQAANETIRTFLKRFQPPTDTLGNPVEPKFDHLFEHLYKLVTRRLTSGQYFKQIVLLTANDSPCSTKEERDRAVLRIKDLNLIADVEFLPIQIPGISFDGSKFYGEFYCMDQDISMFTAAKLEELSNTIRKRVFLQRPYAQLPFEIVEDVNIGLNVYSLVIQQKPPVCAYTVNAADRKVVKVQSSKINELSGEILSEEQIKKYFMCGAEKVFIDDEEKRSLSYCGRTGTDGDSMPHLRLLGFKPIDRLKLHHTLMHPNFLYPNETIPPHGVLGGKALCHALIVNMLEKQLFAVCRYVPRSGSIPRLIALLPQGERLDKSFHQWLPPGFVMLPLPFADDVRRIDLKDSLPSPEENPQQKQERVEIVSKLLQRLRLPLEEEEEFDLSLIKNPRIETFYAALEALALPQQSIEPIDDVLNKERHLSAKSKALAEAWKEKLTADHGMLGTVSKTLSTRSARTTIIAADIHDLSMTAGGLNTCVVYQLRTYCKEAGLKSSGKKQELIERIQNYVRQTPGVAEETLQKKKNDGKNDAKPRNKKEKGNAVIDD